MRYSTVSLGKLADLRFPFDFLVGLAVSVAVAVAGSLFWTFTFTIVSPATFMFTGIELAVTVLVILIDSFSVKEVKEQRCSGAVVDRRYYYKRGFTVMDFM